MASLLAARLRAPLCAAAAAAVGAAGMATCTAAAAPTEARAIAILGPVPNSATDSGVRGTVTFAQSKSHPGAPVRIVLKVTGLKPGPHGIHVHAYGDLSKGCASAGGHFNPGGAPHGGPHDPPSERHVGDLGNIVADESGTAEAVLEDYLISLAGPRSVIGRSLILHADEDDLGRGGHADSKTVGHAGARLACAVIGLAEDATA